MNANHQYMATIALIGLLGLAIPISILSPLFGFMAKHALLAQQPPAIEYAIFDLGGVLLQPSKGMALRQLGLRKLLRYILTGHNPHTIQKKLFEIIDQIEPLRANAPLAYTPDGSKILPQLFQDWLSGIVSSEQIRTIVCLYIDNHPEFFVSTTEQHLVHATTRMIFTPASMARLMRPSKEGINFVRQCKKQGLQVLILSNFDSETMTLMQKNYPEFFEEFDKDNIFISGDLGTLKPDPDIYEILLETCNIDNPASCVFFDDQQENIDAAQAYGINSFMVQQKKGWLSSKPNFQNTQKQLTTLMEKTGTSQASLPTA